MSAIFKEGSVSARMLQFYSDCPDEELTFHDAIVKFNASISTVRASVRTLERLGKIESVHVIRLKAKGRAT